MWLNWRDHMSQCVQATTCGLLHECVFGLVLVGLSLVPGLVRGVGPGRSALVVICVSRAIDFIRAWGAGSLSGVPSIVAIM